MMSKFSAAIAISIPYIFTWGGSGIVDKVVSVGSGRRLCVVRPIVPVGTLEECMGSAVQLLPISGAGNFIYSGTHIRAHITKQAHLECNHLEPGYHGDNYSKLMNVHHKIHSDERPSLCDICGKRFKTPKQLRNHKVRVTFMQFTQLSISVFLYLFIS
ncbi:hypothetical protein E2C01_049440 [Portunus trituberculatus]|uniref:C2H2-type domain-containing protein n=1 Tax=Portunus trituberculatus TaxID=210409 RepID=A0A5B7G6E0_PORTR|nr:hypothetical protein [Portunus trituberculatus]